MATLADAIEAYLKQLIGSTTGVIEVRRCDLAESFSCAPSQINYVLETRFSTDHGYIVESRRGGGGFIRIRRVSLPPSDLYDAICEMLGNHTDEATMLRLLGRLIDNKVLSGARAEQIYRFISTQTAGLAPPWSHYVRACTLKGILLVLLHNPDHMEGGGGG